MGWEGLYTLIFPLYMPFEPKNLRNGKYAGKNGQRKGVRKMANDKQIEALRKELNAILEILLENDRKLDLRLQRLESLPHNIPKEALRF